MYCMCLYYIKSKLDIDSRPSCSTPRLWCIQFISIKLVTRKASKVRPMRILGWLKCMYPWSFLVSPSKLFGWLTLSKWVYTTCIYIVLLLLDYFACNDEVTLVNERNCSVTEFCLWTLVNCTYFVGYRSHHRFCYDLAFHYNYCSSTTDTNPSYY